jgi:hypothetical protein
MYRLVRTINVSKKMNRFLMAFCLFGLVSLVSAESISVERIAETSACIVSGYGMVGDVYIPDCAGGFSITLQPPVPSVMMYNLSCNTSGIEAQLAALNQSAVFECVYNTSAFDGLYAGEFGNLTQKIDGTFDKTQDDISGMKNLLNSYQMGYGKELNYTSTIQIQANELNNSYTLLADRGRALKDKEELNNTYAQVILLLCVSLIFTSGGRDIIWKWFLKK